MTPVETTVDAFLGGRIMVRQPRNGYRAGIDAVFLAAVAPCVAGSPCRVLDIGAGVGTVGLCVAARCQGSNVTLLEREPDLATLARGNIADNKLAARVHLIEAGIGDPAALLSQAGLAPDSFDHVLANPPYHAEGHGTPAPGALKAASHAMPQASLDGWVRFMARMAKPGGTAAMVHKAEALAAILAAFATRFGDIRILPLHPRDGEPATRIIVQGIKASRAPLVLLSGFVLLADGHTYTPAAQAVLRDGAGVRLR